MKKLILITNSFPFGFKEAFLEKEVPFLLNSFDKITIIAKTTNKNNNRVLPRTVELINYNPATSMFKKLTLPFFIMINFKKIIFDLIIEKKTIKQLYHKQIKALYIYKALHDIIKGMELYYFIKNRYITKPYNQIYVYSYWFDSSAYSLSLLKRKFNTIKAFTRAHGSDLYLYVHKTKYLPLRKVIANHLNAVFFISEFGKKYFQQLIKSYSKRFKVSRLGVPFKGISKTSKDNVLRIVSCSNIISSKRLFLIIKALAKIKDIKIHWTHIGTGQDHKSIEQMAKRKLGLIYNLTYQFLGQLQNKEIIKFYQENPVDLFITTSSSEGIPVTIMEALSFGIPIMATQVGGIPEIVNKSNGILLSPNPTPNEIASNIIQFKQKNKKEINSLRKHCQSFWNENFNANTNYSNFIQTIYNL